MNEILRETPQLTRRNFVIKGSAALGSVIFADKLALLSKALEPLTSSEKLTPAELLKLPPNKNLPAVGFSIVPDSLAPHYWDETLIIAMNFGDLDMGIYGEGFKKARGSKTLKIEQYPQDKKLTPNEWENYIAQVISKYKVIKAISPTTLAALYGEANDDEAHNHLKKVLGILKERGFQPDEGSTHFYDHPGKLKGWLEGYQEALDEFFNHVPVQISEMGKQINFFVPDEQHAALMVQDLALAAAYVEQERINFAAWFTAASFKEDQSDSIFRFSETDNGKLEPSHLLNPWHLALNALNHDVKLTDGREITIVSGRSADNHLSWVVWNKTNQPLPCQVPANRSAYDLYAREVSSRRGQIFLPPTKYPEICFGNPIFIF